MNRRDLLRATLAVPVLAACGRGGGNDPRPTPTGPVSLENVGEGAALGLEIIDAEAEMLQGQARYAFGLAGPDGPLTGAKATVHVGQDPAKPPTATVDATELTEAGLDNRGLYVATIPFPTAGEYFVAVVAETGSGRMRGGTRIPVRATTKSPAPGDKVPSIKTPTTASPMKADPLCSRRPKPCTMHAISLDQALKNGKPTVITFAAPAFCRTELCGPGVEITQGVADRYGDRVNFIHVEAYVDATNATDGKLAPALKSFEFDTEPWLYVLDSKGVVSDRISGAFATAEIEQRLKKLGVG